MDGNILLWIISILQILILSAFVISTLTLKGMKLKFSESTIYKELHYIKALLVFASIVLVFFGLNICVNVKKDISNDLKANIEQNFNTALKR